MSWIEGAIWIGVGFIPWLFASGSFPLDYQRREAAFRAMPILANKPLMRGTAVFLWVGGAYFALNDLLGWGLPR